VNRDWPDRPIKLCGPGADSGTYDYFNKAINGDESNSRKDYAASEDDREIVKCVASDPRALAYFGYGYYKANTGRLRSLAVVGRQGPVSPSMGTVQNGSYSPLSRPLFLYVNASLLRADPELRRFASYVVANGMKLSESAGAVPLPPSTYRLVETKLHKLVLGSSFAGDLPVGLTIGEALRRSFDAERRPEFR
jgi:phosphate transport system substrate-binding protein